MNKEKKQYKQLQKVQSNETKLNNIINLLLENTTHISLERQMNILFELMIWSEKKSPQVLFCTLQTGILEHLVKEKEKQNYNICLLKGMSLLLGNCVEDGIIITYILQNSLGNMVLQRTITSLQKLSQPEQMLQYIGSFLKSYSKHFKLNTAQYYIIQNRCLVAQVCCYFYNCPEQLTQTSVMNILMSMLSISESIHFIMTNGVINQFYKNWANSFAISVRCKLIQFDKIINKLPTNQLQFKIQQINDLIVLCQDFTQICPLIFKQAFQKQLLYPILYGPISLQPSLILGLKYGLWIIYKLMTVWNNLRILKQIIEILFITMNTEIIFSGGVVSLIPFNLKRLIGKEWIVSKNKLNKYKQCSQKIRQFYLSVSKSKDNYFLTLVCKILTTLSKFKPFLPIIQSYPKQLQNQANIILNEYLKNLIYQLQFTHTVQNLVVISECILEIEKYIINKDDIITTFVFLYQECITDLNYTISNIKYIDYMVEVFQYDLKNIQRVRFNDKNIQKNSLQIDVKIFTGEHENNKQINFYQSIPETQKSIARYKILKFLIFLKLRYALLQAQSPPQDLLELYNRKSSQILQTKDFKVGQTINFSIKQRYQQCKLIDNKQQIKVLIIQDQKALIVGLLQKGQKIKIMMNINFKHLNFNIKNVNEKPLLQIKVNTYEYNFQNIVAKPSFILKGFDVGHQFISLRIDSFKQQQLSFINRIVSKATQDIPQVSLI